MQRAWLTALLAATALSFLVACTTASAVPSQISLVVYRYIPSAFVEYSADLALIQETPFTIPSNCGLVNTFPAPLGPFLLVELTCPSGQTVLFLELKTGSLTQPVTDSDSHFLAWTADGEAAYLKVDSLGNPRVVRAHVDGTREEIPISPYTYDLSVNPVNNDLTFSLSRGLGYGSELSLTQYKVRTTKQLYADPANYISFACFSPDGQQIAFIKTPDTPSPFLVGELWVMSSEGANARKLAQADSGHGYAANWSPDGTKIAFVVRENPEDTDANFSSEALISNIRIVEVESGKLIEVTNFENAQVETPFWSPDGNTLSFNVVINGRMTVSIADLSAVVGSSGLSSAVIQPLGADPACCPAWMRK